MRCSVWRAVMVAAAVMAMEVVDLALAVMRAVGSEGISNSPRPTSRVRIFRRGERMYPVYRNNPLVFA